MPSAPPKSSSSSSTNPNASNLASSTSSTKDPSTWSVSSNELVTMELVSPSSNELIHSFHPFFTYPMYGDTETIHGYLHPQLKIKYACNSLSSYLSFTFEDKTKVVSHSDLIQPLLEYLPKDVYFDEVKFLQTIKRRAKDPPPGTKVHEYTTTEDNKHYEIYLNDFHSFQFRRLYHHFKAFPCFFIEGGTMLDINDTKWEFFILYEKPITDDSYQFIGYLSSYPFFCYPNLLRRRLSQLIILPPFQRQGHATQLYSYYTKYVRSLPQTFQLVIEDPSEEMDKIRDIVDLQSVLDLSLGLPHWMKEHQLTWDVLCTRACKALGVTWLSSQLKFHPKQAERLYEMAVLHLGQSNPAFRYMVKLRIFRKNKEALIKLSEGEIKDKLHVAYTNVLEEYMDRLATYTKKWNPIKPDEV